MSNLLQFSPLSIPAAPSAGISDADQRARALDTRASFIVEAPAGSGKTGLMVQRFLKLLLDPELDSPAGVLAITFTNKATAELRERVLHQLQNAAARLPLKDTASAFDLETRSLAEAVLARDAAAGWGLLDRPQRLNIRSIDSACAALAGSAPLLSGSGGERRVLPDSQPLYLAAARRTLQQLGGENAPLHEALRTILLHRDGQLADTERLLASMLAAREQWGELVPLGLEQLTDDHLDRVVRARLESVLESIVCAGLSRATQLMPPGLLDELSALASRWAEEPGHNGSPSPIALCREFGQPPAASADTLDHWRALIHLLLKPSDGEWRKSFAVNHVGLKLPKEGQARLKEIIAEMESERLREALLAVRNLPPARYPDDQWAVTKALFHVLRHALAELKVLFAERSECDFAELSLAARDALHAEPTLGDLALAAGGRLRHLLVDEMQDTSASQYDLLEHLTRSWDGHTQTLFLVGDPKQSIYLFRQARVERFLRTMREGFLGELPLTPLRLTANFRSQAALVSGFNDTFDRLFPHPDDDALRGPAAADVPFVEATAVRPPTLSQPVRWHVTVRDRDAGPNRAAAHTQGEAAEIVRLISAWRQTPLPSGRSKPWRIAVLARGRNHLVPVATELRAAAIPYRAVEIESLAERLEVLDCLALTRALLQPADRIAWLAVLHAPWCGLDRADLLALTGEGAASDRHATVAELVSTRRSHLSPEGQQLLDRAWPVLEAASATLGRTDVATHVERTWRTLGGDAALTPDARRNALRFFELLREVEALGEGFLDLPLLSARLAGLFADPGGTEDDVQLMTIHKAKGLEWDIVLVPGLERRSGDDRAELLNWLELDTTGDQTGHILLAPIQGKGEASDALNTWLRRTRKAREHAETKRVFYVACTRAREELHLFAALETTTTGQLSRPAPGSLLQAAWAAAEPQFEDALRAREAAPIDPAAHEALLHLADEPEDDSLALAATADPAAEHQMHLRLSPPAPKLHRLPLDLAPSARFHAAEAGRLPYTPAPELPRHTRPERPEGSFAARAFGNVVHRFLERLTAQFAAGESADALLQNLPSWEPRITASLRGEGVTPAIATREAARVLTALRNTLEDPIGRWILAPHTGAASESALSTPAGTLRADRLLRAGLEPAEPGSHVLWIIDFKTTERGARSPEDFATTERAKYEAHMERYAVISRAASGHDGPLHLALYYPLERTLIPWAYAAKQ